MIITNNTRADFGSSQKSPSRTLSSMPDELLSNIMAYLDPREEGELRLVSQRFQQLDPFAVPIIHFFDKASKSEILTLSELQKCGASFSSEEQVKLDLSHEDITDPELLDIIKRFPNITEIDLCCCNALTDAGLAHLRELPLTSLDLRWCDQITDEGLAHLRELRSLTSLYLSGSLRQITDAGLAHLRGLPLTSLNLSGCRKISDAGLAHLRELPLTSLSLFGCRKISDAGLAHLRERHPNIKITR